MEFLQNIYRKKAIFSEDRKFRYVLTRIWDSDKPPIVFIMLNPSTADEYKLDPTNRRVVNYCKNWGYGKLITLNLFALRSTDPKKLYEVEDPVGPLNDFYIKNICQQVKFIIAGWGTHGTLHKRNDDVFALINAEGRIFSLEQTKEGHPKHPLYVKRSVIPIPYCWKAKDKYKSPILRTSSLDKFMKG